MKRFFLTLVVAIAATAFTQCNNSGESGTGSKDSTVSPADKTQNADSLHHSDTSARTDSARKPG